MATPPDTAIIRELHAHIEGGMALNQALRQHAKFDALYCNLVAAGELAGMLDTMLERLAHHLEKSETLRTTIRSALIYPSAVLDIAGIVLVLVLVFVVPAFQKIFASFGAELPWLTRWVIALSEGIQRYGLWLMLALHQLVAAETAYKTTHSLAALFAQFAATHTDCRPTHPPRMHSTVDPHLGHLVCGWRTTH